METHRLEKDVYAMAAEATKKLKKMEQDYVQLNISQLLMNMSKAYEHVAAAGKNLCTEVTTVRGVGSDSGYNNQAFDNCPCSLSHRSGCEATRKCQQKFEAENDRFLQSYRNHARDQSSAIAKELGV